MSSTSASTARFQVTDSELTDDDIILRYNGDEVIGVTILGASQR